MNAYHILYFAFQVKIEPDTDFKSPVKTVKQEAPTATVKKEAK